jgi:hypothetical protein
MVSCLTSSDVVLLSLAVCWSAKVAAENMIKTAALKIETAVDVFSVLISIFLLSV